jgi:hypothetical protein
VYGCVVVDSGRGGTVLGAWEFRFLSELERVGLGRADFVDGGTVEIVSGSGWGVRVISGGGWARG